VSLLALPDLPVLVASTPSAAVGAVPVIPGGTVQFTECSAPVTAPAPIPLYTAPAPRLAPADYAVWAGNVSTVLTTIQTNFREVQFVAAFPLPQDLDAAAAAENLSSDTLAQDVHDVIVSQMPEVPGAGLSTAFLQLSYPWLKTTGSGVLSESLEPPDGLLAGILARNALTRGAFMDATKIVPAELSDVWPLLPAQETQVPSTPLIWDGISPKPLITRLSLFGFTPAGLRLLSDVTASPGESYRPARVHRLIAVISRAARRLGEQIVFGQNGPPLRARVERSLQQLLMRLWRLNALDGDTIQDAFSVRCDSSTMTQNDLDSGRLIAQVTFQAAATVELIHVTLALETSGATSQGIALMAEAS
jgi:phage tail sheath protein FI